MSNVVIRILASIGFAYLVLLVVGQFAPNLSTTVAAAIALLCGAIVSLTVRDRKTAERNDN